jgi:hypothetical protein
VGKAADWLREERRKVLGDWSAFCLRCGGEMRHRCPSCNAPFSSTFAVDCEECKAPLREPELFGVRIRR